MFALPLLVGALLMMLEGVLFAAYGGGWQSVGLIPSGGFIPSVQTSGYLLFVEGALLLVLLLGVLNSPSTHRFVGVAALTLGLLSLFSGGGFLVGAATAYLGGVLAVFFQPTPVPVPPIQVAPDRDDYDPVIEADVLGTESHFSDLR